MVSLRCDTAPVVLCSLMASLVGEWINALPNRTTMVIHCEMIPTGGLEEVKKVSEKLSSKLGGSASFFSVGTALTDFVSTMGVMYRKRPAGAGYRNAKSSEFANRKLLEECQKTDNPKRLSTYKAVVIQYPSIPDCFAVFWKLSIEIRCTIWIFYLEM